MPRSSVNPAGSLGYPAAVTPAPAGPTASDRTKGSMTDDAPGAPAPVHALFYQRYAGDDALLQLSGLRFAQLGVAAELYAGLPADLDKVLPYLPPHPRLPTVHLSRGINLLEDSGRALVREFAGRFAGRVAGLVVHDRAGMADPGPGWLNAMAELSEFIAARPGGPMVYLEYASDMDPARFTGMIARLHGAERISVCVDVGHLGRHVAAAQFAAANPGLRLADLSLGDGRLPGLAAEVQQAVGAALPGVQEAVRALGALGKPVHFHLHDGHPLVPGLADHFTFLTRLPVPFEFQGRRSLDMLYGPAGLDALVATAMTACAPGAASLTLEVHQVEGRLPLADAAGLFGHWQDLTNAERTNYWLHVLAENAMLVERSLAAHGPAPARPAPAGLRAG